VRNMWHARRQEGEHIFGQDTRGNEEIVNKLTHFMEP
jgi:hypothetical protein